MSPVLRKRHSRHPRLELSLDEARTLYLACRDAETLRRWNTRVPCGQCRLADTGICARHSRDVDLAEAYARMRTEIGGRLPLGYPDGGELPQ